MTRTGGAAFWLALVLTSGFATFSVKYAVQSIGDQLLRVQRQTAAEQQEIRVLNTEWTFLNQPERLADLNQRFLHLVPITSAQLQRRIEDITLRAPAPVPDQPVAANAPPSSTSLRAPAAAPTAPALKVAAAGQMPSSQLPVRLATADPTDAANPLDALFAQIADKR